MNYKEREQILSKDILTIADIQNLTGLPYQSAAKLIRNIRRSSCDAVNIRGRVATHDYLEFFAKSKTRSEETSIRQKQDVERPLLRAKHYV